MKTAAEVFGFIVILVLGVTALSVATIWFGYLLMEFLMFLRSWGLLP